MRLTLALGAAVAALSLGASAQADRTVVIQHDDPGMAVDSNHDNWVTRAEAAAAAERIFDSLDSDHDGRLTSSDHPTVSDIDVDIEIPRIELEGGDGDRRIRIIRRGPGGAQVEREIELAEREVERAEREAERAEREAERAAREAERAADEAERRVERHVTIIRDEAGPLPPRPPRPPRPPMLMMMFASSEEADLNGDGALSRDEFRAQQLRFFDASDANGDGRVRHEPPPAPPEPPEPPVPPEPPR